MVYCLSLAGKPITPEIHFLLQNTGQEMYQEKNKSVATKADGIEGRVTSDFRFTSLGNIFGIQFSADIEFEAGKTHVEFVIHDCDLVRAYLSRERPEALTAWLN